MKKILGLLALCPLTIVACDSGDTSAGGKSVETEAVVSTSVKEEAELIFGAETDLTCYEFEEGTLTEGYVWSLETTTDIDITTGEEFDITYMTQIGEYLYFEGWVRLGLQPAHTYITNEQEVIDKYWPLFPLCEL